MIKVKSKKLISIFLSLAMLLSSIFVGGMVASAATDIDSLFSTSNTYDHEGVTFKTYSYDSHPASSVVVDGTEVMYSSSKPLYFSAYGVSVEDAETALGELGTDRGNALHFIDARSASAYYYAKARIYDDSTEKLVHYKPDANTTYEIKFKYYVADMTVSSFKFQVRQVAYQEIEYYNGNSDLGKEVEICTITEPTNGWVDAYATFTTSSDSQQYMALGIVSGAEDAVNGVDVWVDDVVVSECINITAHNYDASSDKAIPVSKNTTIADIEIPEVEGYRFCGIYADADYATKLDTGLQAGLYTDLYFKWEPIALGQFYCGFEDYKPQAVAMSYDTDLVTIGGEATYVGSKALKATLKANGITAFELRNESAFEIAAGAAYTVTFAYKADADVEIYAGIGKAGDVPGTSEALAGMEATGDGTWKTATLTLTPDKGTADGYAIAMLLYTENAANIFIDDVLVSGPNVGTVNPELNTNFSPDWYPGLALFEGIELPDPPEIWDGTPDTENTMEGTGTEADPFKITNGDQLAYAIINGGLYSTDSTAKYFVLTKDIYLNDTNAFDHTTGTVNEGFTVNSWLRSTGWSWNAAGTVCTSDFQGTIDGDGHTIYGLYLDTGRDDDSSGDYNTALIPRTIGETTIKNLGIDNTYFRCSYTGAAFIARTGAATTIENCYVGENVKINCYYAAALISRLTSSVNTNITNCYSLATVVSNNTYGLVGGSYQNKLYIKNCYNNNGPLVSYVSSNYSTIYKFYDSYQTVENGTGGSQCVYGVTTITDTANMQGTDVFDEGKMPNLNSSRAYISTESYPVLAVHEGIEVPDIWDGSTLTEPKDTDSDGVYEITNGAELAYVIKNNGMWSTTVDTDSNTIIDETTVKSFKLTKDIYLNDVDMIDWSDGTVKSSAYTVRSWYTGWNGSNGFIGTIDGDGHTVYGLYLNSSASGTTQYSTGLIPLAGDNVTVKNLGIDNSYLNYSNGNTAAFVGARVETIYGSCSISIENCYAGENTTLNGYRVAVFRGYQQYGGATTNITNCYSLADITASSGEQGLVTTIWGTTTIKNTYTTSQVDTHANASGIAATNVYEGVAGTAISGVTTIPLAINMQGTDVFTDAGKMPNLNADGVFTATTGYPVLTVFMDEVITDTEEDTEDTEPEIWGGTSDLSQPADTDGDGIYEITNGAELAWAVKYNGKVNDVAAKFILTSDIYLNELDKVNWTTGALDTGYTKRQWWNSGSKALTADGTETTIAFAGSIDGDGHTIYGLYYKTTDSNLAGASYTTALLPRVADNANVSITNLGIDYSYIDYEGTAAVFVGILGQTTGNAGSTSLTVDGCYAGDNVKITGNYSAVFRGYAYGAVTNITNSYSRAAIVSKGSDSGLVTTAYGTVNIKNTYTTTQVSTNSSNSNYVKATNVYEGIASGATISGVTKLDAANMKGDDVLTSSSKMSGLASANAFVPTQLDFADHDYYVYLPEGTVFTEDFQPSFYDTFFMSIAKEDILLANTMQRGAYVKFAVQPVAENILVPEDLKDFVHQGTLAEIKAMDYQTEYYGIQSQIVSQQLDKQSSEAVNYVFITDIHYNGENTETNQQGAALLKQMQLIVNMANEEGSNIDFIAIGGDIIEGTDTKANAITFIQTILDPLKSSTVPVFIMSGNHDDNSYGSWSAYIGADNFNNGNSDDSYFAADKLISKYEWDASVIDTFVTPTVESDKFSQHTIGGVPQRYYYYDLVKGDKTTRIFVLDAIDYEVGSYNDDGSIATLVLRDGKSDWTTAPTTGTDLQYTYKMGASDYIYSDAQIQWLSESLAADGYDDVIFLSHMGIDSETSGVSANGDKLRAVISDFNNKTGDLADTDGKILSYQFGHIHAERELYSSDIDLWQLCTSTAKAGQAGKSGAPWRALTYSLDTESEACFDVMSVSPTGIVKMNIGAGTEHNLISYLKLPAGDVNTDETADICDLVKLSLVANGTANKTTAVDVDKNKVFAVAVDAEALRKLLIGAK